jgi:hypothetical protein
VSPASAEGSVEEPVRLVEAGAAAVAGAALAGLVGSRIGLGRQLAVVGLLNGAISGWRGIYEWRRPRGIGAFVLDSTWGLASTAGALGSHGIAVIRGRPGYAAHLSHRENRHVYERGFQPRARFLITVGNVVSGAGDTSTERRQRLVRHHEDEHVWQARWLGPLYPPLYAGWMAAGGLAGAGVWLARGRREPLTKVVETCAYYLNPFEWWAYSRDGNWPPGSMVAGIGWRHPMVRSRVAVPVADVRSELGTDVSAGVTASGGSSAGPR